MIFQDRQAAGTQLAEKLIKYQKKEDVIVVGLARGGVIVAAAVAKRLHLPLDILIIRKVGAPDNEELALGAIAEEGEGIFNHHLITLLGVSKEYLKKEVAKQKEVIQERKRLYLKGKKPPNFSGKTIILVDDGIATGASMKVAIQSTKSKKASKIVVAVPVAATDSLSEIATEVDEVVCLSTPPFFQGVGAFYNHFEQTTDEEIVSLLIHNK